MRCSAEIVMAHSPTHRSALICRLRAAYRACGTWRARVHSRSLDAFFRVAGAALTLRILPFGDFLYLFVVLGLFSYCLRSAESILARTSERHYQPATPGMRAKLSPPSRSGDHHRSQYPARPVYARGFHGILWHGYASQVMVRTANPKQTPARSSTLNSAHNRDPNTEPEPSGMKATGNNLFKMIIVPRPTRTGTARQTILAGNSRHVAPASNFVDSAA